MQSMPLELRTALREVRVGTRAGEPLERSPLPGVPARQVNDLADALGGIQEPDWQEAIDDAFRDFFDVLDDARVTEAELYYPVADLAIALIPEAVAILEEQSAVGIPSDYVVGLSRFLELWLIEALWIGRGLGPASLDPLMDVLRAGRLLAGWEGTWEQGTLLYF
jgi:hypothetical protein